MFVSWKNGDTPLIAASQQDESAPLELLLKEGANIEAKNKVIPCMHLPRQRMSCSYTVILSLVFFQEGCTALMLASSFGKAANVRLLLRAGADIEAKDKVIYYPKL